MRVRCRAPDESFSLDVEDAATVYELRTLVAERCNRPVEQIERKKMTKTIFR